MIVLLVSTLKLSELRQLFSTSFISFRRFGANIMHFFLFFEVLFVSGIFQKSQPNPDKKSHHLCLYPSLNSAHLRYDHLFPWNAFVLPACPFTGWIKPTVLVGTCNNHNPELNFARWGCFIAGMSFACLAPPHHAHHVRLLRK